jgi:hypothetical protein
MMMAPSSSHVTPGARRACWAPRSASSSGWVPPHMTRAPQPLRDCSATAFAAHMHVSRMRATVPALLTHAPPHKAETTAEDMLGTFVGDGASKPWDRGPARNLVAFLCGRRRPSAVAAGTRVVLEPRPPYGAAADAAVDATVVSGADANAVFPQAASRLNQAFASPLGRVGSSRASPSVRADSPPTLEPARRRQRRQVRAARAAWRTARRSGATSARRSARHRSMPPRRRRTRLI